MQGGVESTDEIKIGSQAQSEHAHTTLKRLFSFILWLCAGRYVGVDGGSFTNVGGFNESDLKVPKVKKPKKPEEEEEPSSIGDMAGKAFVKGLNKGINSGMGLVGAG